MSNPVAKRKQSMIIVVYGLSIMLCIFNNTTWDGSSPFSEIFNVTIFFAMAMLCIHINIEKYLFRKLVKHKVTAHV